MFQADEIRSMCDSCTNEELKSIKDYIILVLDQREQAVCGEIIPSPGTKVT